MLFCVLGEAECLYCASVNAKGDEVLCFSWVVPFVQNRKKDEKRWVLW